MVTEAIAKVNIDLEPIPWRCNILEKPLCILIFFRMSNSAMLLLLMHDQTYLIQSMTYKPTCMHDLPCYIVHHGPSSMFD